MPMLVECEEEKRLMSHLGDVPGINIRVLEVNDQTYGHYMCAFLEKRGDLTLTERDKLVSAGYKPGSTGLLRDGTSSTSFIKTLKR